MAKYEAKVEELVAMIERGELRLPEMQRRYVWQATRVRDLVDLLYRGYPTGTILLWETDEPVPLHDFAVDQQTNPYQSTKLLLDGQQRLTSLLAVLRGQLIHVRGRKKPIELLFNLEHPDKLAVVTEVDGQEENDDDADTADATEDELHNRLKQMAFVVFVKRLASLPNWISVSDVFKTESDVPFLRRRASSVWMTGDSRSTVSDWRSSAAFATTSTAWTCWNAASPTTKLRKFCAGQLIGCKAPRLRLGDGSDHGQVARLAEDVRDLPERLLKRGVRPGPGYSCEEPGGVCHRPVAFPHGWQLDTGQAFKRHGNCKRRASATPSTSSRAMPGSRARPCCRHRFC